MNVLLNTVISHLNELPSELEGQRENWSQSSSINRWRIHQNKAGPKELSKGGLHVFATCCICLGSCNRSEVTSLLMTSIYYSKLLNNSSTPFKPHPQRLQVVRSSKQNAIHRWDIAKGPSTGTKQILPLWELLTSGAPRLMDMTLEQTVDKLTLNMQQRPSPRLPMHQRNVWRNTWNTLSCNTWNKPQYNFSLLTSFWRKFPEPLCLFLGEHEMKLLRCSHIKKIRKTVFVMSVSSLRK